LLLILHGRKRGRGCESRACTPALRCAHAPPPLERGQRTRTTGRPHARAHARTQVQEELRIEREEEEEERGEGEEGEEGEEEDSDWD
jgi:hypothetical protein